MDHATANGVHSLSAREQRVLELATLGLTNHEIAERIGVSVHAVKFHLASVYRKLHVGSRTEAAVRYLEARHAAVGATEADRGS